MVRISLADPVSVSQTRAPTPAALLARLASVPGAKPQADTFRAGGERFHIYSFATRRLDDAPSAPPRTVGMVGISCDDGKNLANVRPHDASELCLLGPATAPPEAARDKVVFVNRRGKTLVFQADRQKETASLVACGNAASAAAALLAQFHDRCHVQQTLPLPEETLEAANNVQPLRQGWAVEQTWAGCRFEVRAVELCGRPAAICRGTFNDYFIVRLPDRAHVDALAIDKVQALWEAARPWGFDNPLRARLVAVAPGDPNAWVRFFTCGRLHPGAPLTGLATLALAVRQLNWLADALHGSVVEHARGRDVLPVALIRGEAVAVAFPAIAVDLCPQPISSRLSPCA